MRADRSSSAKILSTPVGLALVPRGEDSSSAKNSFHRRTKSVSCSVSRRPTPRLSLTSCRRSNSHAYTFRSSLSFAGAISCLRSNSRSTLDDTLLQSSYVVYSLMSVTTPAPTVRPPSRIAKRSSVSIAIGVMSSISSSTLSPGMTISVPSGSVATPVTSVVRK